MERQMRDFYIHTAVSHNYTEVHVPVLHMTLHLLSFRSVWLCTSKTTCCASCCCGVIWRVITYFTSLFIFLFFLVGSSNDLRRFAFVTSAFLQPLFGSVLCFCLLGSLCRNVASPFGTYQLPQRSTSVSPRQRQRHPPLLLTS